MFRDCCAGVPLTYCEKFKLDRFIVVPQQGLAKPGTSCRNNHAMYGCFRQLQLDSKKLGFKGMDYGYGTECNCSTYAAVVLAFVFWVTEPGLCLEEVSGRAKALVLESINLQSSSRALNLASRIVGKGSSCVLGTQIGDRLAKLRSFLEDNATTNEQSSIPNPTFVEELKSLSQELNPPGRGSSRPAPRLSCCNEFKPTVTENQGEPSEELSHCDTASDGSDAHGNLEGAAPGRGSSRPGPRRCNNARPQVSTANSEESEIESEESSQCATVSTQIPGDPLKLEKLPECDAASNGSNAQSDNFEGPTGTAAAPVWRQKFENILQYLRSNSMGYLFRRRSSWTRGSCGETRWSRIVSRRSRRRRNC